MANVKSYSRHPEDLDDGSFISPGETRNIDVSLPLAARLVAEHKLLVVGADATPTYLPIPPKGNNRGAFQALTAYTKNDIVSQAGALYQANADFVAGASFSGSDWTLLSSESSSLAAISAVEYDDARFPDQPTSVTEGGVTTDYTYNDDGSYATETRDGVTRTFTYSDGILTGATV